MDDTWAGELAERAAASKRPTGPIARHTRRARIRLRGRRRAQGATVAAFAILAVGATPAVAAHSTSPAGQAAALGGLPRFTVSIPAVGVGVLNIRNAVTSKLTGTVTAPQGAPWDSVSAQGGGSFVATTETAPAGLYEVRPDADGTSARVTRIATIHNVIIFGSAISRSGSWFGYLDFYTPRRAPSAVYLRLQNLRTGKIFSWTVPQDYTVGSLSIDAAGNAMAVSAFYYLGHGSTRTALIQHTYILRPASAGRLLSRVPPLINQAGAVALAPGGRTVYETLQATGLSPVCFLSHHRQTFEVAAISTATGRITAVLHTWRTSYQDFVPLLALDPAGRYLLVYDNKAMSVITLSTGRYTPLPGTFRPELIDQSHPGSVGGGPGNRLDPLAW
jgi:hypothetical protein